MGNSREEREYGGTGRGREEKKGKVSREMGRKG